MCIMYMNMHQCNSATSITRASLLHCVNGEDNDDDNDDSEVEEERAEAN